MQLIITYKIKVIEKHVKFLIVLKHHYKDGVKKYLITNNIERKESKKKIVFDNEKCNFIKTHIKEHPNTSLKQIAKETNKKFKTTYNYVDIHRLLTL